MPVLLMTQQDELQVPVALVPHTWHAALLQHQQDSGLLLSTVPIQLAMLPCQTLHCD
jgi:hypothetical protein